VAAPKGPSLPHADHPKIEKKDLENHHSRKRPRSRRDISGADAEGLESASRPSNGVRSKASSSTSKLSNRRQDSALHAACVAGAEKHPENKYERKPRHKTRPDKYELKVDQRTVEKGTHERTHRKSNRKRRKKTGLAFNHDFKAPNVPQDRLTLKPNTGPGIFHRGKASALVERRGLPDLTFSEMNFLTKRRYVDVNQQQRYRDIQPPKKSKKGSAPDISDFFSRTEEHDVTLQGPPAKVSSQRKGRLTKQSISPNKSSPARPGVRKPLSLISGNETGARAFSTNGLGTATRPNGWVLDPQIPAVQHCYAAKRGSSVYRNQSNSILSYDSWSATPSRKSHHCADLHEYSEARQLVARERSCEPRPPSPPRRDLLEITKRPLGQSSISDRSLEHYTRHVLLGEHKQGIWDCVPRTVSRNSHYSLQDLKRLARLSELGDVNGSSAIQSNQHRDAKGRDAKGRGGIHLPLTNFDEHKHVLPTHTSNGGGLEASTARPLASIPGKGIHRHKGADFVIEASADPAVPGPQVAQSGRQGLLTAGPAHHLSLRDSTRLGNIKFTSDRVAWLLSTDSPAPEGHNRATQFGNTVQTGNHPPGPLWRTLDSGHRAGIDHEFVESGTSVRCLEHHLTAQAHIQESNGRSEPDKKLDHLQVEYENHQHQHWIGHAMLQDTSHQDSDNMVSNSHDEFDQALLRGPATFVDNTANILDLFGAAQPDSVFAETATRRSDVRQDLTSSYDEPTPAARDHKRSNIEIGLKHLQKDVAASGLGIDGLQRNQTWHQSLRPEGTYQEVENEFMGFARPHILY
jgi:hypothetical protein